ncbi:MAG TPA: hypothetical protein P5337_01620 [Aestuariivirga sp.]|nr:hypothetical protein [Aestuariivirga sp.]
MFGNLRSGIQRINQRMRHRREYAKLLQYGDDRIFRDIGVNRIDVERKLVKLRVI